MSFFKRLSGLSLFKGRIVVYNVKAIVGRENVFVAAVRAFGRSGAETSFLPYYINEGAKTAAQGARNAAARRSKDI